MIITNFETREEGAFLTWIEFYDMLVAVYLKTGGNSIEDLDKYLFLYFLQSVVRWKYIDCK